MLRLKCSRLTRFDHQFHHESKITWLLAISSLSNNSDCSNCISIVSKRTQCENLQLPIGNSLSIQILKTKAGGEFLQPHSQVIVPAKHHGYPAFPKRRFSMNLCIRNVSNLNLHLILNILWAISSPPPPWRWNGNNGTHLCFPPVPLLLFHLRRFCSVFLLGDKSLTYTNKHNS